MVLLKQRPHLTCQDYIDTYYSEKKSSAQAAKIKQVESRKKMLEKMELIENPDVETGEKVTKFSLSFPEPSPLRVPLLVQIKNVNFKYPGTKSGVGSNVMMKREFLLNDVTVEVNKHSRIGFLGANGSGKSTLIKLISGELEQTDGIVTINNGCTIAIFTQHHVDTLSLGMTPVQQLQELFPNTPDVACRRFLGRFGLV